MKTLNKDELYENLRGFLKRKGIELTEGAFAKRIQQGCGLLTDAINVTQKTVAKAREKVDAKLEHMQRAFHKDKASQPAPGAAAAGAPQTPASKPAKPATKTAATKAAPKGVGRKAPARPKSAPRRKRA